MDGNEFRFGRMLCMLLAFFFLIGMQPSFAQNAINDSPEVQMQSTFTASDAGDLLFSDNFDSSKSGWPIYSQDSSIMTKYKNGKFHVTIFPEDNWQGVLAPRLNVSDFVIEVEATKEEGPNDNVYGVWIRNQAPGSLYGFQISSDGYYQFVEKENSTWITPSNWTSSSAIKTGNETNLIKVIAKGDKFAFFANDVLLGNYVDDSFKFGGVGLWVGTQSEGNVTIGFDNFKVWSLKE